MRFPTTFRARARVLLHLGWPIIVARSTQAVISFSDAAMCAPLGDETLAAVTTGAMNAFAVIILPMGIAYIVQSFASQLKGEGDLRAARRYAHYGLLLSLGATGLGLATLPGVRPALALFPFQPAVRDLMGDYVTIRLLAVGAVVGGEVLGNWFGGLGDTRPHMVAGILAMVTNIFFNWVFIFGHLGAPAMGAQGAALASVISSWLGFAFLSFAFVRGWVLKKSPGPLGLRASEFFRMLRFGLPAGFNWFLEFAAFALFLNVVVADLGTPAHAAMMVVIAINHLSFMPAFALASAGAILAGQAIGENRKNDVPAIAQTAIWVAAGWQGLVGLSYLLIPALLVGVFARGQISEEMRQAGAVLLALSAAWQMFDAVAMVFGEVLRAAGDTAWTMWVRLGIAWCAFVPAAYVCAKTLGGGYVAAMLSLVGYLVLLAAVFAWRFRGGAWRRIDLTGRQQTFA